MPPTMTTRIQTLLKKTERMKQQTVKGLLRTMKHIDAERKKRTADLDEAARAVVAELQQWGHMANGSAKKKPGRPAGTTTAKATSKRRVRRSPEQLKSEAVKVVALIRSTGKDGIAGSEIRKKFPGVGQNIKGFVQQYTGEKLKTTGEKAGMKYHHAA